MVHTVRQFFKKYVVSSPENSNKVSEHSLQIATTALLVEMMRADSEINDDERNAITNSLQSRFGLSEVETTAIIKFAEDEIEKATGYYEFTSLINKGLSQEEKIAIIEQLWEIAFSDSLLDKYEEHMVRKIANLIHVSHKDFIDAKLRVRKRILGV
jgi:uncharacterized tellurite resistance protein B-like protein